MKIKEGAVLTGLQLEMRKVLVEADKIWKSFNKELVVTEGTGGAHSAGSLHYYGYAVDLRSYYFTSEEKFKVVTDLKNALGGDYDVIVHNTHIHVEYDRVLHND